MNDGDNKQDLDQLLNAWKEWTTDEARHAASAVRSSDLSDTDLHKHIRRRLAEEDTPSPRLIPSAVTDGGRRKSTHLMWLGIAAAILAIVVVQPKFWWNGRTTENTLPHFAQIADEDVTKARTLVAEYEAIFGESFSAVCETPGGIDLTLASMEEVLGNSPERSLVRLALAQQEPDGSWSPLWQCDVVASCERLVENGRKGSGLLPARAESHSVADAKDGIAFTLWTHRLPDGKLIVDVELRDLPEGMNPGIHRSLVVPGSSAPAPQKLGCTSRDGKQFCLFQTAVAFQGAAS